AMHDAKPENRPALARLGRMCGDLAFAHACVMIEGHGCEAAVAPDQTGECGDRARRAAAVLQRGDFRAGVEILRLDANVIHPPVTGGNNATSSSACITAFKSVCCLLIATRINAGSRKPASYFGRRQRRQSVTF